MYLLHSDNNHYDLLLDRLSRLAVEGPVSFRLNINFSSSSTSTTLDPHLFEERPDDEVEFNEIMRNSPKLTVTDHLANQIKEATAAFSPMIFKPCPRGPGRPRVTRVGAPHSKAPKKTAKRKHDEANDIDLLVGLPRKETTVKRPRGRPKGSKNKPKETHRADIDKASDLFIDLADTRLICY